MPGYLVPRSAGLPVPKRTVRAELEAAANVFEAQVEAWERREIGKAFMSAQADLGVHGGRRSMDAADELMSRADGNPVDQEIAAEFTAAVTTSSLRTFNRMFGS